MRENKESYPDINSRHQFCETFDYEDKIRKEWQKSLKRIHSISDLDIPSVFVNSHSNWNNDYEVQMFLNQSQILLEEIKKRPGLTCDSECVERMEISVRNEEKKPKILGIDFEFDDYTELKLVCNMFHGFDKAIYSNAELNWIHNGITIQNNPDLKISVHKDELHDITMVTNLTRTDIDPSVGGTYECRYGTSTPKACPFCSMIMCKPFLTV